MTTVVCDLSAMASDSLIIDGSLMGHGTKIFRVKGDVVGYAGTVTQGLSWVYWLKGGADPEDVPELGEGEFAGMRLTPSGILTYESDLIPIPYTDPYYAIGSGAHAAMAAMYMGATPKEAVKIASKVDVNTGGRVKVLEMKR